MTASPLVTTAQMRDIAHGMDKCDWFSPREVIASLRSAADQIDALKADAAPGGADPGVGWIPCAHVLPDDRTQVLCTDGYSRLIGMWISGLCEWWSPGQDQEYEGITHWMELPKAPPALAQRGGM